MSFEHIFKPDRFMGATDSYDEAKAVLYGMPMDFTTSYRPGTRFGPTRIREASYYIEMFSYHQARDLEEIPFYDLGEIEAAFGNVQVTLERGRQVAEQIVKDGKIPFMIGGEHLCTVAPFKAVYDKYGDDLILLHFDAHADLREEYMGERYSHATAIRRCLDWLPAKNLYQFGIRSGTAEEYTFAREQAHLFPEEVLPGVRQVIPELGDRPVYITVDVDVVDPAGAPGTGTPEPGGISSRELFAAIRALGQANINLVGFDLVEVAPGLDVSDQTVVLGAKIIREALLAFL